MRKEFVVALLALSALGFGYARYRRATRDRRRKSRQRAKDLGLVVLGRVIPESTRRLPENVPT